MSNLAAWTLLVGGVALVQFAPVRGKRPPTPRPTPIRAQTPAPTPVPVVWHPTLLWKTPVRQGIATAAASKEGSYVVGATTVHRIDLEGRTDWTTEIGPTQSEVALDAKRVYVGSERGTVYALDRQSGAVAWKATLGSPVRTTPLLVGERLVVESLDSFIYGLDVASGTVKWKFARPDGSLGYASPAPGPAGSVLVCGENTLYRLDAESGEALWHTVLGGKALATPSVQGELVFVAGDGAGVVALSVQTGERLWRFRVGDDRSGPDWFGPPLVAGKMVYVSTYRRNVYALEAATGKLRWSTKVLGPALARPALDERRGVLYLSALTYRDNPTLTALNSRTGETVWDFRLGSLMAAPTLQSGRLYLPSTNGNFYAFSIQ